MIMTRLRRDFKDYINNRSTVYYTVGKKHPDWMQDKYKKTSKGTSVGTGQSQPQTTPLTQAEKEYVKSVQEGIEYDERVAGLIFHWTDKSLEEQGRILSSTPKGTNWRKRLADQSKDHMIELAKRMTDSAVGRTLNDLRTLNELGNAFADILYEEQELRERNKGLASA